MPTTPTKRQTKKYLRTLVRGGHKHPVRSCFRIFKYGIVSFGRNIWLSLASTLVMTITILILFVTVLASVVLAETATSMRDKIDITVFLKPGTSEADLAKLSDILKSDSNVRTDSILTNTSEDELTLFLAENADNPELVETVSDEDMKKIMLTTIQSTIRFKVVDIDNLASVKTLIETDETFAKHLDPEKLPTYDMNQAEIRTINSWANIAKSGGIVMSAIFLVISMLVIFNTVRMSIYSRKEEIYMMKLVGASPRFIRGPFLVEAQLAGFISGAAAATLGYFGFNFLAPRLESYGINVDTIRDYLTYPKLLLFFAAMILLGSIIGYLSAHLASHKYLRKL
ncbi:FtsX-like permease family protein [Candidatus Saccharibacteria bacterium]|nr:FtsX-like permease family protein [Candidatus Saccharibacteria bacterium]MBQ6570960.1 FtsX-like permease family protein [Candidatus Saccharibacteria bacterium]